MSHDLDQAREDLAFMRALADAPGAPTKVMGQAFFAAGLIYGFQTLVQWAAAIGLVSLPGPIYLGFVIGCTVVFLIILSWLIWRNRHVSIKSVIGRAYEAAFMAAGFINLTLVTIFTLFSIRQGSAAIWDYYTPMIFVFQGGAWTIAFRLSKRWWLGAVAVGWFGTAIALAATNTTPTYVLVASIAMFVLLAIPGWIMMRSEDGTETA